MRCSAARRASRSAPFTALADHRSLFAWCWRSRGAQLSDVEPVALFGLSLSVAREPAIRWLTTGPTVQFGDHNAACEQSRSCTLASRTPSRAQRSSVPHHDPQLSFMIHPQPTPH